MAYRHQWSRTESRQQATRRRQPQTATTYGRCPRCGKSDTIDAIGAGRDLGCERAAKVAR